jgi:butyryl-CoA dehydrogenase
MMNMSAELGLIGGSFEFEHGGMQMPAMVMQAATFVMECANNNMPGYPGLTAGAANLIATFGTPELTEQYVPHMLEGKWAGTMCLTEPGAGSSLSDVITTATPTEEGHYMIKGQKIFISGGDHEYCENFVHLVLARIDGAPAGTKGISLFVVPKHRPTEGGLESNDVVTAGDFQKMGQRGYCTTHLLFGSDNNTRGWLVGAPHRGLPYMFQMMNEARIAVGRGGASVATAAYHASLQYAHERAQGRRLNNDGSKNVSADQNLIIEHPDVRRMLLKQKAISEGALSLVLQASLYHDMHAGTEGADKENNHMLLEMLTPVTKTYPSEKGKEAVDNGVQVLGGYGFCSEYILQQYLRDIRIMSIYEGTTGIQSMDLLGRKIPMGGGKGLKLLQADIQESIEAAMTFDDLKPYANVLMEKLGIVQKVLGFLMPFAMKGEHERYLSDATHFMDMFGTIIVAWQWLKMATTAKQALVSGSTTYTAEFYQSKIHTMRFFYKYELSEVDSLANILMHPEVLTILEEKDLIV